VVGEAKHLGLSLSADPRKSVEFASKRIGVGTERVQRAFSLLLHPSMKAQYVILFTTAAVQHWLDFYGRHLPPEHAHDLYREWDISLLTLVNQKLGRMELVADAAGVYPHLAEWRDKLHLEAVQMQLPVQWGGMGFRPQTVVSKLAYPASLASCANEILGTMKFVGADAPPDQYVQQYEYCRRALIELAPKLSGAVFVDVSAEIDQMNLELLPTCLLVYLRQFQDHPVLAEKFQKRLSKFVWQAKHESLVARYTACNDLASVRRLSMYTGTVGVAGRIFTMIPTSPTTHLACAHVAQAVRQQLGALPAAWMYLKEGVVKCRQCRARVDFLQVPTHGLHCVPSKRGFVNDRHDAVCRLFASFCKRNGVPFLWAPKQVTGKETDVGMVFAQHAIQGDVTFIAKDAPSVYGSGARAEQSAAQGKVKRYKHLVEAVGELFFPLVFFTSGAYSVSVSILLKRIRDAGEENGSSDPVGHQEMRDRLAATIVRYNALMGVHAATHQRADNMEYAKSRELKRARKRRSHRAVAGEGDAGHGIEV
jgi:hypothetical protein